MYYVNKIVGWLVSPIGIAMAMGVLAWVLALLKCSKSAKWFGYGALVWLWLWMMPVMTRIVGAPLESEFLVEGRVPEVESFPEADAIVVLGGSMGIETNLSNYAEMWTSADRVWQAARLWKAGKAPKILATSKNVRESTLPLLRDFGVPEDALGTVDDARNTEEEAKSIEKMGIKKILLVTSAWHMKRARMMFKKYAPEVEVVCAPADFENSVFAARPFSIMELFPDHGAFMANSYAFHEWIGLVGYWLFR